MKNFLKVHFPSDKQKFKIYFKQFIPTVMGSFLFALNGVIDNFMVGKIDQGVTALSSVNQWTIIIIGWFLASASAGSVVLLQFYHDNNIDYVKKISRYRFFLCIIFVIPFIIIAWFVPDILISSFYKDGSNVHNNKMVYKHGREYLEIISFQWLLMAFSFNMGNQFAELGYGKYRMYFGFGALLINIFLNSMLIYVADMGVQGAAIASLAGLFLFVFLSLVIIRKKNIPISYNIFKIFNVNKKLQKIYWRRWIHIFSIFIVTFFISFRAFFYARGYPSESLGIGISATSVLGLTGSIMNMFAIIFGALSVMSAVFVSSELGKGNYKQAKINANELKGFNTFMAFIFSIFLFIFSAIIPYMNFLSKDQYDNEILTFDSAVQLKNVRNSLFVLALYYPLWIWFLTSYWNGNAGGKGTKFAIFDFFFTGPLQLGWIAIIMFAIVPSSPFLQHHFAISYAIFFISDLIKFVGMEYLYYRDDKWLHSIIKSEMI